jgi:hypothetical protein
MTDASAAAEMELPIRRQLQSAWKFPSHFRQSLDLGTDSPSVPKCFLSQIISVDLRSPAALPDTKLPSSNRMRPRELAIHPNPRGNNRRADATREQAWTNLEEKRYQESIGAAKTAEQPAGDLIRK